MTLRDLALYFSGGLDEENMLRVDLHLDDCPFCAVLAERVGNEAQVLIDAGPSAAPLAFLRSVGERFAARVDRWIEAGSSLALGLRVERGVEFVTAGLERLAPRSPFQLSEAITSGVRGPGPENSVPSICTIEVPGAEDRAARVIVDPVRKLLVVELDGGPELTDAPLVALHEAGETTIREMERYRGRYRAEFSYSGDAGELAVLLEP